MVDAAPAPGSAPGPMFSVDRVDDWLAGRELDLVLEPFDITGGRIASFRDAAGNQVYVMDQSTA
jgi:predicted enzyme related to lactoylglutathione lyase